MSPRPKKDYFRIGVVLLGLLSLGCNSHLRVLSNQMTVEEYLQFCKTKKGKVVEYFDQERQKIIFSKKIPYVIWD